MPTRAWLGAMSQDISVNFWCRSIVCAYSFVMAFQLTEHHSSLPFVPTTVLVFRKCLGARSAIEGPSETWHPFPAHTKTSMIKGLSATLRVCKCVFFLCNSNYIEWFDRPASPHQLGLSGSRVYHSGNHFSTFSYIYIYHDLLTFDLQLRSFFYIFTNIIFWISRILFVWAWFKATVYTEFVIKGVSAPTRFIFLRFSSFSHYFVHFSTFPL